jgi:hypothetical protein
MLADLNRKEPASIGSRPPSDSYSSEFVSPRSMTSRLAISRGVESIRSGSRDSVTCYRFELDKQCRGLLSSIFSGIGLLASKSMALVIMIAPSG